MTRKTVTVFGATGTAGSACVDELIRQAQYPLIFAAREAGVEVSWSTGRDVGRIIPHVLAHPLSRNAICPVAATAYCSWNELLAVREQLLGRKVARTYPGTAQWKAAYEVQPPGPVKEIMAIGTFLPEFKGTPLEELFPGYIEPFVAATRAALLASGAIKPTPSHLPGPRNSLAPCPAS